jgi:DNA-directed RNA polymerase specialized sigma24 family protein
LRTCILLSGGIKMERINLVSAAQKGDKTAANRLIEEYWRVAAGIALIKTSNKEDAEDIAQDAILPI